ncbi:uncharacterized protein LOC128882436, partial [Hylaeus volcanicus]|uniref:uncharacterized protein LOC128882436 n=1 Tax=Hylaeus volcanicus TaxID=313075 RepID=UPI0023B7A56B
MSDQEEISKELAAQKQRMDTLKKFVTNYSKDGKSIKNKVEYFEKRLQRLQDWWVSFDKANHELIETGKNKKDEYFTDNHFEKAKTGYQDIRSKIQQDMVDFKQQTEKNAATGSGVSGNATPIKQCAKTTTKEIEFVDLLADDDDENESVDGDNADNDFQEELPPTVAVMLYQKKELFDIFKMLNRNETVSQGVANAQLDQLKIIWSEFRATYRQVKVSTEKKWCDGISFNEIQQKFVTLCGKLNDTKNNSMQNANVKLPKVKLPEFDCASEAAKKVSHLTPEESNYQDVYSILERQYGNKRENVGKLIEKILDIPCQSAETSNGLKNLFDTANECLMAIKNYNVNIKDWDPLIIHILKKKLHKSTVIDYESKLNDVRELQTLSSFLQYVEHRFMALLSAENSGQKSLEKTEKYEKKSKKVYETPFGCTYCNKPHSIYKCFDFKKKSVKERSEWAKNEKACVVCLQMHEKGQCSSKYMCKTCGKKHNTLLHFEAKKEARNETQTTLIATTSNNVTTANTDGNSSQVQVLLTTKNEANLLPVAFVNVLAKNGEKILMKSIVDGCSQGALMTENAFQKLNRCADRIIADVEGVAACTQTAKKIAPITVQPHFTDKYSLDTDVIILKKITNLAYFKDDLANYDHLQNLLYADPTVNDDGEIDLLLGVAEFSKIVKHGLIKGAEDSPIAMNSELGWLIMGPQSKEEHVDGIESEDNEPEMSEEERYCEEHYVKNTKRDDDGRLNVSMAFKNEKWPELGDSRKSALATLFQLEKRFEKNQELKKQYSAVVKESIESGHLVVVENPPNEAHYIPHHAVFKESTTTKLRSVYNASQKTSNGKSLNEQLAVGKIVQPSIFELMLRWRESKIAIVADLEKMYKQIRLNEKQQHLQMILWRNSGTERIKSYKMTTVTFGLKNSSFLAIRSLHEIAKIIENKYPRAAKAIMKCFYVDDYTGGAESVEEALCTYREMKKAFDEFGFNLRKLVSNSTELLKCVPGCDKEEQNKSFVKALGIPWKPETDEFIFQITVNLKSKPETKRQLSSEIASLQYDPLGWIAPVIVKAKILFQDVWQLKKENKKSYDWDDKLPIEIIDRWMLFKSRLSALSSIKMQRWLGTTVNTKVEVHGFCDACKKALSANVYLRFVNENQQVNVMLVAAKTKNAPMIEQTIPKLELCATVLLVKLVKSVRKAMSMNIEKTVLYSDSKVALAWICSDPLRYKKFVASRIKEVNKLKDAQWCHIPGAINPADCASRGIFGDELVDHPLWWHGPHFLNGKMNYDVQSEGNIEAINEEKIHALVVTSEEKMKKKLFVDDSKIIWPNISSWKKMQRVFAYIIRFVDYLKAKVALKKGIKCQNVEIKVENKGAPITANEIEKATNFIIRIAQSEYYECEVNDLEKCKEIEKTSELLKLNVFIDEKRILRVGGRITNEDIPFEMRHPILIPKKSEIAKLIIRDVHETNFHTGPKLTEALIRKKFWITNGQTTIKKQLKNCVICRKFRPKTAHQMMANRLLHELTIIEKEEFNDEVANELTTQGIMWKFSPPAAPHFNGLVEAGVKTIKTHLKRALGEQKFTFEELSTLLAQIEAAANSRPLTPMSCDTNDSTILTPAHFLLNSYPVAIANENFDETEYLHTIQQRAKWHTPNDAIKKDDLVLISDSAPVGKWPMGRVLEVHQGQDGLTRVATVKTANNTLKRPITKLAPLPIDRSSQTSTTSISEEKEKNEKIKTKTVNQTLISLLVIVALATMTKNGVNAAPIGSTVERVRRSPDFWLAGHYYDKLATEDIAIHKTIAELKTSS